MEPVISRNDQAMMDFVAGLKLGAAATTSRRAAELFEQKAETWTQRRGRKPETVEEVGELMYPTGIYRWHQFIARQSQEMMWNSVIDAFRPFEDEWSEELANVGERPDALGSLELDPECVPDWFLEHEIHIQPGGFHSYALAGPLSDWGGRLYRPGVNESGVEQQLIAAYRPAEYTRILDMGCGTGRSTIPYKRAYPEAEVWGIELGEPLLRYAHHKAEDLGLAIHYAQMDTASMRFGDETFDRISSNIIFHEMPVESTRATLRETFRVVRPGGVIVIADVTPHSAMSTFRKFVSSWQDENNGEPFWTPFQQLDMAAELREAGFADAEEIGGIRPDRAGGLPYVYTAMRPG